jgi:hypothetical protein
MRKKFYYIRKVKRTMEIMEIYSMSENVSESRMSHIDADGDKLVSIRMSKYDGLLEPFRPMTDLEINLLNREFTAEEDE